jgi:hypothetical protein
MRRILTIILLFVVGFQFHACKTKVPSENHDNVMQKRRPCSDTMAIDVFLYNKPIYQAHFYVSARNCREKDSIHIQKTLTFSFRAKCNIFSTGEDNTLDSLFDSFGTQLIEGDIWQAGNDSSVILLGVSFVTKDQILLNTIHIAIRDSISESELADGLFIKTCFIAK